MDDLELLRKLNINQLGEISQELFNIIRNSRNKLFECNGCGKDFNPIMIYFKQSWESSKLGTFALFDLENLAFVGKLYLEIFDIYEILGERCWFRNQVFPNHTRTIKKNE